ncbi:MAG: S9 family peptidase, partial [Bdellovibrionales bacterium]|nr:S9 family peptidase [Bdellovibrionales bacterium]
LPGYELVISSVDRSETKFVVRTYNDRTLGSFFLFEKESSQLKKIADLSPWLKEEDMVKVKPIAYSSRDGLTINGYLTLPKESGEKYLPFVIYPHGGPWHRDQWGYDPTLQWLANRGYGILQMNFRGSTGYGKEFWKASFKQWGRNMQNDITDGVQWLISNELADPKRICIFGGSYGGYAVLAGLAFTPDLYACGVDYVGVSNLFTFLNSIPPYWKPYLEMMYEMIGHPEGDKELLLASSPVFHAEEIKAPLLVAQGAKDPRVNIDESNQIVQALRTKGQEVEYLIKENEGHGFYNEENRFELYRRMEEFFSRHLRP